MISDYDLRIAATEAAKALVAAAEALEDDGEPLPTPKWEHKLRLWDMWWDLRHALRHAAAACLVAALGLTGWLTVDAQAREAFTGWVRGVYEDMIAYHAADIQISEKRDYLPGWIPEGYTELFRETDDQGFLMVFRRQDGRALQFGYLYNSESGAVLFDTTGMTRKTVKVNGKLADLWNDLMGDAAPVLVWEDGYGQILYVSADLTEGELIRFAERTKKNNK